MLAVGSAPVIRLGVHTPVTLGEFPGMSNPFFANGWKSFTGFALAGVLAVTALTPGGLVLCQGGDGHLAVERSLGGKQCGVVSRAEAASPGPLIGPLLKRCNCGLCHDLPLVLAALKTAPRSGCALLPTGYLPAGLAVHSFLPVRPATWRGNGGFSHAAQETQTSLTLLRHTILLI
jgi:hypothetical protein